MLRPKKKSSVSFMIGAAPLRQILHRSKPRARRTFLKTRRLAKPKNTGVESLHAQCTYQHTVHKLHVLKFIFLHLSLLLLLLVVVIVFIIIIIFFVIYIVVTIIITNITFNVFNNVIQNRRTLLFIVSMGALRGGSRIIFPSILSIFY